MYSSHTAASFGRFLEIADRHGVNLDAALTWAFTFEEQPPFAGFLQLASCGINLPVLVGQVSVIDGNTDLKLNPPRQAVSLLVLTW